MGKLLSLLSRDDNCCSSKSYDIFLDFENAAPSDLERDVYEDVERVLKDSDTILEDIQLYRVSIHKLQWKMLILLKRKQKHIIK